MNTQLKYERGDSEPDISYLTKIEELGADYSYIVTGDKIVVRNQDQLGRECALVFNAVELLENVLIKNGKSLQPEKKARAASMLFRLSYPSGLITEKTVEELINLAE